ncbi:hypothetical protein GALMADRAFT_254665, partial [Galerina marginata CBS 339.88]
MLRIQLRGSAEQQHRLLLCWDVTTRLRYSTLISRSVPGAVPRLGGCHPPLWSSQLTPAYWPPCHAYDSPRLACS